MRPSLPGRHRFSSGGDPHADIPILQGAILALALCFVATNLVVDLIQTAVDPRIANEPDAAEILGGESRHDGRHDRLGLSGVSDDDLP
jgi:hypothetical protein